VSDNGHGIPDEAMIAKSESLGVILINALASQLEATMTPEPQQGTAYI